MVRIKFLSVLLLAAACGIPAARAAESFDGCAGTIATLPATISTQGVWCVKQDLSTAISAGAAITVKASNVTIDCNGFKLNGMIAGPASMAVGILAENRLNTIVRGCNLRGFFVGIRLYQGGGHLVEDNRIDGSLHVGVQALGSNGMVRRNTVTDTGQPATPTYAIGIWSQASTDIIDNTVDGVVSTSANAAVGIHTQSADDAVVAGNRVRGLVPGGGANAIGISNVDSNRVQVRDNHLFGTQVANSFGIVCANNYGTAAGNMVSGFTSSVFQCQTSGNIVNPN